MAYVKFILWAKSLPNGKCHVYCKGGIHYWCDMSLRDIIRANRGYGLLKIHQSWFININFISKRHVFNLWIVTLNDGKILTRLVVCRDMRRDYETNFKKVFTEVKI